MSWSVGQLVDLRIHSVDGVYKHTRVETAEEAAVRRDLEAQIERALREEKERKDASEADDEQAQRLKRRRSLEEILQAQKLQKLGRAAKASPRGGGKGPKLGETEKASWRLPEHFRPPEAQDPRGGAAADPETLWRIGGEVALAANGWRRLESRRKPGRFYFSHESGKSKPASSDSAPERLAQDSGFRT
eukprot:s3305_g2.t1